MVTGSTNHDKPVFSQNLNREEFHVEDVRGVPIACMAGAPGDIRPASEAPGGRDLELSEGVC